MEKSNRVIADKPVQSPRIGNLNVIMIFKNVIMYWKLMWKLLNIVIEII